MSLRILTVALFCSSALADDTAIPPSTFTSAGHTTDKLEIVKQRVKQKKSVLLDVREKNEWDAGHLKYAKLVPMSVVKSGQLTEDMQKNLPKNKPIYIHCAAGARVLTVSKLLRAKGYDIRPLKDGYSKLLAKGFEKADPKDKQESSDQ